MRWHSVKMGSTSPLLVSVSLSKLLMFVFKTIFLDNIVLKKFTPFIILLFYSFAFVFHVDLIVLTNFHS